MIAMALVLELRLLIADEPTTALDVTTQDQVLKLISELQHKHDTAVLFITHDMGWWPRSPTGSMSCAWAKSSRARRSSNCCANRGRTTPASCSSRCPA